MRGSPTSISLLLLVLLVLLVLLLLLLPHVLRFHSTVEGRPDWHVVILIVRATTG